MISPEAKEYKKMDLQVKIQEPKPGSYNISIKGKIHSDNYTQLEDMVKPILEKNAKTVVLDLADMNYISSAGLGVIFMMMKSIKENKGELLICNLQPQIQKVFEIVKALPTSSIFSSVEEADAYLDHIMNTELDRDKDQEG
jgi:anti-anti-sigma factor